MVNNSTNINKTNKQPSALAIEHKKNTTFGNGNPGLGLGRLQNVAALSR
jgi:hypothetical protein